MGFGLLPRQSRRHLGLMIEKRIKAIIPTLPVLMNWKLYNLALYM